MHTMTHTFTQLGNYKHLWKDAHLCGTERNNSSYKYSSKKRTQTPSAIHPQTVHSSWDTTDPVADRATCLEDNTHETTSSAVHRWKKRRHERRYRLMVWGSYSQPEGWSRGPWSILQWRAKAAVLSNCQIISINVIYFSMCSRIDIMLILIQIKWHLKFTRSMWLH